MHDYTSTTKAAYYFFFFSKNLRDKGEIRLNYTSSHNYILQITFVPHSRRPTSYFAMILYPKWYIPARSITQAVPGHVALAKLPPAPPRPTAGEGGRQVPRHTPNHRQRGLPGGGVNHETTAGCHDRPDF